MKISSVNANERYRIGLKGLAVGTFTLRAEEFVDSVTLSDTSYIDVPVSPLTQARLTLQHVADATQLQLDLNGDGIADFTLSPDAQPNAAASLQISPQS